MKKLIVLSVDSLFDDDVEFLKTLPNFGKLLKNGSYVKGGMRCIYPTFTYPAHASIITGTYPEQHGIFHNEKLDIGNPFPDWYWYHNDLKVDTVIDCAQKAGYSTASIGWPVMGGCENADYLIAEIWDKPDETDIHKAFIASCSKNVMEDGIFERHYHKLRRTKQPFMDHFMVGCTCDIIHKYKPDVIFIHLAHLDHTRHANGLYGPMVEQAIVSNDDWLGRLMEATMDVGTYEDTNFVVIGDHGHLAVSRVFNPNILLVKEDLITLDSKGEITDWQAYCNSTSLSCQVVMKNPQDLATHAKLENLLYKMRNNPDYGVECVFTKEECQQEWHLTGNFEYVMEGTNSTSFGNKCVGDIMVFPDNSDYKFSIASHGHLPHKGAQPTFLASGPDFKENTVIERCRIIDEAPTFAKILGFTMNDAQGRVIEEILKQPTIKKNGEKL